LLVTVNNPSANPYFISSIIFAHKNGYLLFFKQLMDHYACKNIWIYRVLTPYIINIGMIATKSIGSNQCRVVCLLMPQSVKIQYS